MLRFCDSFDHYRYVLEKWDGTRNASSITDADLSGTATPRHGAQAWAYNPHRWSRKALGSSMATIIVGMAVRFDASTGNGSAAFQIFELQDSASKQLEVSYKQSTGALVVSRNGTTILSTTIALSTFTYYYFELKATIHNSAGVVDLKINGTTVLSGSSLDTQNTGNASVNQLVLGNSSGNEFGSMWIDDVYVCDTVDSGIAGAPNDDFLGDVLVEALLPNGNGTTSQLDGSDGNSTNNYQLVDEAPPNSDTDYVQSGDSGDKDTYNYGSLTPTTGEVLGIQICPWAKKTDSGARTLATIARESGGTEQDGPAETLSTSYDYYPDPRDGDPDGVQWTIASINAAEFGVKVG